MTKLIHMILIFMICSMGLDAVTPAIAQTPPVITPTTLIVRTTELNRMAASTRDAMRIKGIVKQIDLGYSVVSVENTGAFVLGKNAWPLRTVSVTSINDPLWSQQWDMHRIQVEEAWAMAPPSQSQGEGTIVAILDTGISPHPDLGDAVIENVTFILNSDTEDHFDHGLRTAGIMAARANNNLGMAGVAPRTKLLNVKVIGDNGLTTQDIIVQGIVWATNHGAHVINMSLAGDWECDTPSQDAFDYAWSHGVVIVASSGNGARNGNIFPTNCNHVLGVGASNRDDQMESYSNYGPDIILAPGEIPVSLRRNARYGATGGTSAAAPHVAGIAALLRAVAPPEMTNTDIVRIIRGTVDTALPIVNAARAMAQIPTPCGPRPAIRLQSVRNGSGGLSVTITITRTSLQPNNALSQIQFGPGRNTLVNINGTTRIGAFTITPPENTLSTTFTVSREQPGIATTLPITIVDNCGQWRTFVGGGPNSF